MESIEEEAEEESSDEEHTVLPTEQLPSPIAYEGGLLEGSGLPKKVFPASRRYPQLLEGTPSFYVPVLIQHYFMFLFCSGSVH